MLCRKILYFTPYYPPQAEAAAIRNFWFIKTLRDANHQVKVLSSVSVGKSQKKLFFSKASNKSSALKRLVIECMLGFELFFRFLFSQADLYILSSPPFFSCLIASWAVNLKGGKYILDVRDLYPEVFFDFKLVSENSLPGKILKKLTIKFYQRAYHVVTVTKGLQYEISKQSNRKVELIMNGFDDTLFVPSNEKYPDFTVVFHGNLGKVQNIELILETAKLLEDQNVHFLFMGAGPKASLIEECKLKNVQFLGSIPYQEIPKTINKAHIGISARIETQIGREALPVKVFEYIGSGVPVICTPAGETEQLLNEYSAGIAHNNCTSEMLAASILKLKSNPSLPQRNTLINLSRSNLSRKILSLL